VQFIKCNKELHPDIECKSDEEITEFMRDKWILLLYNQIRFDSNYYGEEAIIQESRIMWVPVNSQIQQSLPFKIMKTKLFLQDESINLDDLTEIEDASVFKLEL